MIGNTAIPGSPYKTYFKEYGSVVVLGSKISGGSYQNFTGVSAGGTIVGSTEYNAASNGSQFAFVQSGSTPTLLPSPAGKNIVTAIDANDNGEVIGNAASSSDTSSTVAVFWNNGKLSLINPENRSALYAVEVQSINERGVVAGAVMKLSNDQLIPFTWQNGKTTFLPTLGGSAGVLDINSSNALAGFIESSTGEQQAAEWVGGKLKTLVNSTGYQDSVAVAINDSDEVVGDTTSNAGVRQAFLYENGVLSNLNSLLPASDGYDFYQALDINNQGQILVDGEHNGQSECDLLTPSSNNDPTASIVAQIARVSSEVPEPASLAALFLGAAAGLYRRRHAAV